MLLGADGESCRKSQLLTEQSRKMLTIPVRNKRNRIEGVVSVKSFLWSSSIGSSAKA